MTLFLFTFFLIYASIHLYAYLKIKAAFVFGITTSTFLISFMVIMVFAPIVIRLSEKQGLEFLARLMSYVGYTWMGLLFLFTSASLVIDIYHFLIYLSGLILRKDLIAFIPSSRISFFIPLILSILIAIYGSFEAKNIRTERVTIRSPKIAESAGRLRIVQISDVHLGLIVRKERLKKILEEVKAAKPDLLVSTGDLVDGQINGLPGLAELLRDINPRYGKFADSGYLSLQDNSHLYVSRGSGTWGPPIRFLSPPEVTVIEIFPAPNF